MGKKIEDIYAEYEIMPNLQEHMFRVAAVASVVCDNLNEPLLKEDIITACLLHDMGNIIKFKLGLFPEFNKPEKVEYWQRVQNKYIEKYGKDDYYAHSEIAKEIGVSERVLELINSISFLGASDNALGKDFSKKVIEYADDRVGPFGVVSLEQRLVDLRKRYAPFSLDTPERLAFENAVKRIEKQIFAKCQIKPEDITNESIAPIISELRNFVIK